MDLTMVHLECQKLLINKTCLNSFEPVCAQLSEITDQ